MDSEWNKKLRRVMLVAVAFGLVFGLLAVLARYLLLLLP